MSTGFVYSIAKAADDEKRTFDLSVRHQGEIVSWSGQTSSNGNAMLNVRVRIDSGADDGKEVFGRITFSENTVRMVIQFIEALGRDPLRELGDQVITERWIEGDDHDGWGASLVGELIGFRIRMSNGGTNADTGESYPIRAEINPFSWSKYTSDAQLDDLL